MRLSVRSMAKIANSSMRSYNGMYFDMINKPKVEGAKNCFAKILQFIILPCNLLPLRYSP